MGIIELVSHDVNGGRFLIAESSDLTVESDETNFLMGVSLLNFLKLGLDGAEDALFAGDEGFVLVVVTR